MKGLFPTMMHGTRLPLRTWFLGAYLVATHSNGISALQLQPKLGLGSYKTTWLLLHKLRRAMVNPDHSPLAGDIEIDETSVPFRKNSDPVDGGQGNSLIGKFKVIGAVELVDRFTPGRIRLEHIGQSDAASIWPFVLANTEPGCLMITDGNPAYVGIPDRTHRPNNLSKKNALPAHISMKWIHRVFSNFKRWGLGTFHGFRDKHINAYANEFVFRWNRRRHFAAAMNTLLGIGQSIGSVQYRGIVGDTSIWRDEHRDQIFDMVRPDRLKRAKVIVAATGEDIFDVIAELRKSDRRHYGRRKPTRTALPPRRPDETRNTRRYQHPPRIAPSELKLGYLRHIPPESAITLA